tara:strand:+ start:770 stop:976 length:207 start_codon:yes stop_codon:yes gene_type:complete
MDQKNKLQEKDIKLLETLANKEKMNDDNKNMMKKILNQNTTAEILNQLMKDPTTNEPISYFESRMRFG